MVRKAARSYHRNVPLKRKRQRHSIFRTVLVFAAVILLGIYVLCLLELVALRWIAPPTTMVQVQRRLDAWARHRPYRKQTSSCR